MVARPTRVRLQPGAQSTVTLTARVSFLPRRLGAIEGRTRLDVSGGGRIFVPVGRGPSGPGLGADRRRHALDEELPRVGPRPGRAHRSGRAGARPCRPPPAPPALAARRRALARAGTARLARSVAGCAAGSLRVRAHRARPPRWPARPRAVPPARGRTAAGRSGRSREHRLPDPVGVDSRPRHDDGRGANPSAREPVRDRAPAAPKRRKDVRDRPESDQRSRAVQEVGRGLDPGDDGRRRRDRLRGLPRDAQHRPWPVQGRDSLPPGRHARRGQGARDVDDVEVRADGPPVRRRQGRRDLRSEAALAAGARRDDPSLHERDHQRDRAGEGHPGPRRGHRRERDGVDLRHLLDEQGPLGARGRDRQAALDRRFARTRRGDGARLALRHHRRARRGEQRARWASRRRAGIRQRRPPSRADARGGGGDRGRGLRLDRRPVRAEGARPAVGAGAQGRARNADGLCRRGRDHERRAAGTRVRRARAVCARAGDSTRTTRAR